MCGDVEMYCRPDAKHEHEKAAIKQAPCTAIVGVGNPGGGAIKVCKAVKS